MSRYGDQVKGFQPFYERAKAFGVNKPEDFDRYDPWIKQANSLEKRGIKADMLERMFSGEADADLSKQERPEFDPVKYKEELLGTMRKEHAETQWADLTKGEKQHVDAALREIFGDDKVDDMTRAVYGRAVANYMDENREAYPKGHPLHETHLQPWGESHAKKAAEYFKAEKAKHAGAAMAKKGDAALKAGSRPGTAAGNADQQGKPKDESSKRSVTEEIDEGVSRAFADMA